MNKNQRFEMSYIKVCWALIIVAFFNTIFSYLINGNSDNKLFFLSIVSLIIAGLLNLFKLYAIKKLEFKNSYSHFFVRLFEVLVIASIVAVLDLGQWAWIIVIFPITMAIIIKGMKDGIRIAICSFLIFIPMFIFQLIFNQNFESNAKKISYLSEIQYLLYFYFIVGAFTVLCFSIYKYYLNDIVQSNDQLELLKEKYRQLDESSNEKIQKLDILEKEKCELEDRNRDLLGSVAEYFTLQQVSQAISSTLDIKELLKYVNDIIIGVMGVSHSTVMFYDEKKDRLKVSITSVVEKNELVALMDNINNEVLLDVMKNDKEIIENNITIDKYMFTKGREIKSIICAPINTKSRKFGLVLAEHKFQNAFNENNARILSIIGQQVGFAMENAELYRKMQELATIDALTGIYNRHYFHDRLQKELKNASDENYDLSLVIFDIDHFKKFNDTYGHLFGDKVLKSIVDILKGCIRSTDVFARFGGEEFIILFPSTNLLDAYEKADMLRDKIAKAVIKDELITVSVTVSFGVSSFPETCTNVNELIRLADDALYEAKNSGRNCVKTAKISERITNRLKL